MKLASDVFNITFQIFINPKDKNRIEITTLQL